ncbi:alpha-ketoglutarate-dependent dioxygenase AlkB family protein [Donghicola mangrovi]|uniref:Alpha-ketoglutarate-dependent dioxygenase AlkB n=1 Tax=Donghicola mangrovi TaxID=2729614 RepID=A0A850Q790_9RHOB|nr:alpha-ketoglutarate-dependent dioxygenase AlkB [Donghicola mangrovi]NVO22229.1 alpha-ketoglutarate-dependent dioxygenase AlkB [Donghicola mangrovi]
MTLPQEIDLNGVRVYQGALDRSAQVSLLEDVRAILRAAPLVRHVTPSGKPMSVRMSAAGDFGWVTDRSGYRYQRHHPSGTPWPPIPASLLLLWNKYSKSDRAPECCLVNWYAPDAKMGLHQDNDEADLTQPVLSISLGDDARFRVGGPERSDPTRSIWLSSGDIAELGGAGRLAYHGVDKIRAGSSSLMPSGGRINLTLRVVT